MFFKYVIEYVIISETEREENKLSLRKKRFKEETGDRE